MIACLAHRFNVPAAARAVLAWGVIVLCGAALLWIGTAPAQAFDLKLLDKSVVRIQHIFQYQGREIFGVHGTGFVLNGDGYVVTNFHVVDVAGKTPDGVKALYIVVPDGDWSRRLRATQIWGNKEFDLAVLHVPGLKRPSVVLSTAPWDAIEKGSPVYALGFPKAGDTTGATIETTFTRGDVSKTERARGTKDGATQPIVQHTASLNPGNSGGPLFNPCGEVIAINTFSAQSTLKLTKGPGGEMVAHGPAVSGVYYSPHVSALVRFLTTEEPLKKIAFEKRERPCATSATAIPYEMYIAVGAVSLIAVVSLLLALTRRGEGPRVVESYSQWIRRRGGAGSHSQPAPPVVGPGAGWLLQGADAKGEAVIIAIRRHELENASHGADKGILVGRSKALCSHVIADASVSRRHARIVAMGRGLGIEDLNSSFGVTVNGKKLEPFKAVPVQNGATVTFGDVRLKLSDA